MDRKEICALINREMSIATGCTEPAAVALAAATAREYMPEAVRQVEIKASVNIIKNVSAVHIPGICSAGIECAAALGITAGKSENGLRVIDEATPQQIELARRMVQDGQIGIGCEEMCDRLYISVKLIGMQGGSACVVLAETHTNITRIEKNGSVIYEQKPVLQSRNEQATELSISDIYRFAETLDRKTDDLHMITQAIRINTAIAHAGRAGDYGLNIGHYLRRAREKGLYGKCIVTQAIEDTADGVDARMAGANMPVVTNAGSGNQGITTTVPVLSAGQWLEASEDRVFRAVTLSNLASLYIHSGFGRLSGLCGATIAATGAACGLVYLMGGDDIKIGYVINNMLGDISGMLCDGAKADCSLKISTCLQAAFQCAFLAMEDVVISPAEGIVERRPEQTIRNFNRLGNEGSAVMDHIIMDILIRKNEQKQDEMMK